MAGFIKLPHILEFNFISPRLLGTVMWMFKLNCTFYMAKRKESSTERNRLKYKTAKLKLWATGPSSRGEINLNPIPYMRKLDQASHSS